MIPTLLLVGVAVALVFVASVQAAWFLGVRRGRALERMEPPKHGAVHANDGARCLVHAETATDAIDRLTRVRVVAKPGSRDWV